MGRRRDPGIDGYTVIDKAAGWTSHDVVARARKVLSTPKVGHSGTLDPDATGVLLLGIGKGTKLLRFTEGFVKRYRTEIVFGVETSTLDDSGEVTARHAMELDPEAVSAAAATFVGEIEQVPPMVSAVKVGGRRLYELARAGEEVERAPRTVTVHAFDVESSSDPMVYVASVRASSGTYVRTLAADLGAALGGGAHLRELRREAIGLFEVSSAVAVDDATPLPLSGLVGHLEAARVGDEVGSMVRQGRVLPDDVLGASGDGPWAVSGTDGLLAVYERHRGSTVKPAVVVARP